MDKIDLDEIIAHYEVMESIWPKADKWHYYTYQTIDTFIKTQIKKIKISKNAKVINLGSGGNSYCFDENNMLHVDITDVKIKDKPHFLISNIEHLEESNSSYDIGLCVGSVINYADALLTIQELSRIIKSGGFLFLEFENSNSFEFVCTEAFGKKASIVTTFYQDREEKIWVYSEKYIRNLLEISGFNIINKRRFHTITPLIYRITQNAQKAARFYWSDKLFHWLPFSSNIILVARKI